MKTKLFFISAVILVSIVAYRGDGLCQQIFNPPGVSVINTKGDPIRGSGTFLGLVISSSQPLWISMGGLKKITAVNIDGGDDNTYEFSLTPNTYNLVCEWGSQEEFTGQSGIYRFTIEKSSGPILLDTLPLPDGLIPLPIPENLEVSFESGIATPTLSVDPVSEEVDFDFYDFRIYDKEYTRRIYRTQINKGESPVVIFDQNPRIWPQTWEDLVPGEWYIFRVDIWKLYEGTISTPKLIGANFKSFKVPKKVHKKYE